MKNCEGTIGIRNRLLKGQGRSWQVIEAPRGRPFGGGAGHRNSGMALPESTGIVQFSWGDPYNIFLNVLWGYGTKYLHSHRFSIPSGAIIPKKVMQHHRKAQGRFGGTGTVPSENR